MGLFLDILLLDVFTDYAPVNIIYEHNPPYGLFKGLYVTRIRWLCIYRNDGSGLNGRVALKLRTGGSNRPGVFKYDGIRIITAKEFCDEYLK